MPPQNFKAVNLIFMAMPLLLSSCDKPKKLDAERLRLSAEQQIMIDQIAAFDNKTLALSKLGLTGDAGSMDRHAANMLQQSAYAEKLAQEKLLKWSQIEAQLNSLRDQTDAYKTAYLR